MILNGPWALADYQRVLKADLGVARLPALAPGKPAAAWVGVKCMMVNANSDDAQAERAKAFALHMTSPDVQRLLAQEAGHIPAIDAVQLPMESPQHVFMAEAAVGTPVSIQSEVSLIWEPMDKAIRQVIAHQSSPEEALAEAETILNAKLAIVREQKP
jgi:maltose-binding protein MalE